MTNNDRNGNTETRIVVKKRPGWGPVAAVLGAAIIAVAVIVIAVQENDEPDTAGEAIEQTGEQLGDAIDDAAEQTGEAVDDATRK